MCDGRMWKRSELGQAVLTNKFPPAGCKTWVRFEATRPFLQLDAHRDRQDLDGIRVGPYTVTDSGFGASTFMVKGKADNATDVKDRWLASHRRVGGVTSTESVPIRVFNKVVNASRKSVECLWGGERPAPPVYRI